MRYKNIYILFSCGSRETIVKYPLERLNKNITHYYSLVQRGLRHKKFNVLSLDNLQLKRVPVK